MNIRKHSRVTFRIDVTVTVNVNEDEFHGEVQDISMNGVFIRTGRQLPIGTPVGISIRLSGIDPESAVHVSGTVSRVTESGIGFTFAKIDLSSYTHLKNIVSYNTDDAEKIIEEIHHAIDEKYSGKS